MIFFYLSYLENKNKKKYNWISQVKQLSDNKIDMESSPLPMTMSLLTVLPTAF